MSLEIVQDGLAKDQVGKHATAEAHEHARQVSGERMLLVKIGRRYNNIQKSTMIGQPRFWAQIRLKTHRH